MRFSVIVTHYQGVFKNAHLQRLLNSLKEQYFKDFEVVVVHDGPLLRRWGVDTEGLRCKFITTPVRYDDWGHSLRGLGMKESSGEYILHTNADNVYYPDALEKLDEQLKRHPGLGVIMTRVKMMGLYSKPYKEGLSLVGYDNPRDYSKSVVLLPNPHVDSIDAMQGCVSREVWDAVGGWKRTEVNSDSLLYEEICNRFEWMKSDLLIGEHY